MALSMPLLVAEVTAADRVTLEEMLDEAEMLARHEAIKTGAGGILVTRHSHDRFTITLTDAVPYGTTRMLTCW
ncbi:hypothetical protein ACIQTW_12415 [Paenarthrobacter sp. NPDC090517]|uniref:hypothetical protein n=1 Tax=Paenarthrobacter sp. NPDC090517 TaxID=3364381 RepID=UPI0038085B52